MKPTPAAASTGPQAAPGWRWRHKVLKWAGLLMLLLAGAGAILAGALFTTALRPPQPVGFQVVRALGPTGQPFALGVWYPTRTQPSARWAGNFLMYVASDAPVAGQRLPLILISHGTGGSLTSHADLALALASAGNVVATPMHTDNFQDLSSVGTPAYIRGRPAQLRAALDHMLLRWPARQQIDPERIGAYGFSIGAFTVLTAAGAQPNLASVAPYCASQREFACEMLRQTHSFLLQSPLPDSAGPFQHDARIKAIVLAAPGLGFSFRDANAFSGLTAPVQLWQGDQDDSVPYASNAAVILSGLGKQVDFQPLANASHYSFLVPCGPLKLPPLCSDPAGFDRAAAHAKMNQRIADFFSQHLKDHAK